MQKSNDLSQTGAGPNITSKTNHTIYDGQCICN